MASTYILYSAKADKYYIGSTKNMEVRFEYHLAKEFNDSFTARYSDWELYFEIPGLSNTTARSIENHIKKMKSRKYIENLKKYPEMIEKLKNFRK